MLTSHSKYERYKMHHVAYFCELQQNQRVLKSFLKILRFQTALVIMIFSVILGTVRVLQFQQEA